MDLRLVLVGLSGVGKSAAGNTILGREEFKSETSSSSLTLSSDGREGEVCGRRVTVVDTPGLFNTELSGEKLREEMDTSLCMCDPGPHAFLLVIQLGRFTQQEKRVMETLQELFSERVNQYTVVLFTYGDRLRNKTIEEFIRKDTNLQQLLSKCKDRYHVFNNEDMENRSQVTELLQKIDKMVAENRGGCYTKGMDRRAEEEAKRQGNEESSNMKVKKDEERHRVKEEKRQDKLKDVRIVLLGKPGGGKSAAGNTILGRKVFKTDITPSSVTSQCEMIRGEVDGRDVSVIDTPGLYDTWCSKDDFTKEMQKCISLSSPGPHVFLVVLSVKSRFTQEEKDTVKNIQTIFGPKSSKYTMVLFTHGDQLKGKTVEKFIGSSEDLAEFTDQCRGGYHVFNNEEMQNRSQVTELLQKIDKMVTINGGGWFTTEEKNRGILKNSEEDICRKEEQPFTVSEGEEQQGKEAIYTCAVKGAVAGTIAGEMKGPSDDAAEDLPLKIETGPSP